MTNPKPPHTANINAPPSAPDLSKYMHLLDDPDIPEDQKEELLRTLWAILMQFIALDIPISDAPQKPCGQLADGDVSSSFDRAIMASSKASRTKTGGRV